MALRRKDDVLASDIADTLHKDLPLYRVVQQLWKAGSDPLADKEDFSAIMHRTYGKLKCHGEKVISAA
ncbi:NAD(P)-dependent oxidoreductase, partial [Pseudomonas syringae pv. tagetis]